MPNIELKSCPFCGNKPVFFAKANCVNAQRKAIEFVVRCENCEFQYGKIHKIEIEFDLHSESGIIIINDGRIQAAEAWNRRAQK